MAPNSFNRDPDADNKMLARVDTDRLGMMEAGGAQRASFLPANFGEAMEMAKLMAAGTFVPARLRGKAGDCLAVIMQASRWNMDPFAVAQKIYFVNDQGMPGYEAQLVVAVLNTSGVLEGTLSIEWTGEAENLVCTVSGKRKDSKDVKSIEQAIKTITTRNSPLWKQSPQTQLGYYTQRLWGRLFAPEVMLGVYAADDLVEDGAMARPIEGRRAPTRAEIAGRVVDGGEVVDTVTGEVVDEEDEETARRLDAEQEAARRGDTDDAVVEEVVDEPAAEGATAEAEPAAAAEEAKAIDWTAWLGKFEKDLEPLADVDAVKKFWDDKTPRVTEAPEGIRNRARAMKDARIRKLTPKASDARKQTPAPSPAPAPTPAATTAAKRTDAAAAAIEGKDSAERPAFLGKKADDEPKPEPEAAAEPAADAGADANDGDPRSPATIKADEIIAEMGQKELLMDLRSVRDRNQEHIDTMDEENAGRVMRAFRALEDKLAAAARKS